MTETQPAPKLNNMQTRIIAGAVGGVIFIGAIYFSEWTFFLLFLALTVLGMLEFYKLLTSNNLSPNHNLGILLGAGLFVLVFLYQKDLVSANILYALPPVLMLSFLAELYRKKTQPFLNIALTMLAVFYVATPFTCLAF